MKIRKSTLLLSALLFALVLLAFNLFAQDDAALPTLPLPTLPPEMLQKPVSQWTWNLQTILTLIPLLALATRFLHSIAKQGGNSGALRAVWFGSANAQVDPVALRPESTRSASGPAMPMVGFALCLCAFLTGCKLPSNEFRGSIGGVPFSLRTEKQNVAKGITLEVDNGSLATTNHAKLRIDELSATNDPSVIRAVYAGKTAMIKELRMLLGDLEKNVVAGAVEGAK